MYWIGFTIALLCVAVFAYSVIGALLDLYEECRYRDEYDEDM